MLLDLIWCHPNPNPIVSYLVLCYAMQLTTSRRFADRKVEKFEKNITKRGFVPDTTSKKGKDYPVGPLLLGFFVFVVIGSLRASRSLGLSSLPDYQNSNKWRHGLMELCFGLCHLLFLSLVENANTSLHLMYLYKTEFLFMF
ncbi:uncharacterized protein HKW66_Vig0002830 [Vigna angularis]|uniref:Uncharacterized protein n=1 Tax=Phaseolus angularis TaxID=3914 RepID=A0A8T0LFX3_PHAAN|nr:uncharacterized protein HKW66_Vig0002830 [Vigna angularis]